MLYKYIELQMVVVIQKPNCKSSCKTPYFFIVKYPFQKEDDYYTYIAIYNLNNKSPIMICIQCCNLYITHKNRITICILQCRCEIPGIAPTLQYVKFQLHILKYPFKWIHKYVPNEIIQNKRGKKIILKKETHRKIVSQGKVT
jgi:hypothetical protein